MRRLLTAAAVAVFMTVLVWLAWNLTLPTIFPGFPEVTPLQAFGLSVLGRALTVTL